MRRLRLAVAAVGTFTVILAAFASTLGAHASLAAGFPATRIKLEPSTVSVRMPGPATLTATVVNWKGGPLQNVALTYTIISGPNHGQKLPGATTDKAGHATVQYRDTGEPGVDVVQATYTDGLEVHKSNRPFVTWLSGPPASAIPSPATIALTPACFQPSGAAAEASDTFKPVPKPTPKPGVKLKPVPVPPTVVPPPYSVGVTGDNFDPFASVLVTFDAGPGGSPESTQARTDGFGHFAVTLTVRQRAEGQHLVRADDFRQREADAIYTVPCFQPSVALNPPIGPPGFVTMAVGTGFPANSKIVDLNWSRPSVASPLPKVLTTDANGSFSFPVLILYHDGIGPRTLQAIVPNPFGEQAGAAIEADAPFLVTLGRSQPSDFVLRR
ncbi:MAG: hypothetical protein M3Z11_05300 [Candidatus Dormibacteraeota bacterium]|nr:hypothetical protein [Candidatus Dormibacteraeota bacterium]